MSTAISQDVNRAVIADRASTIRRALNGRSIVLVGIMGVGKSTIGKRLSQYLDIPFVDADKEIEKAAGMAVEDIFEQFGEDAFRAGEKKVIRRLLDEGQKILATGGGAFMHEDTREEIQAGGVSVWLKADLEVLMKRVQRRPDRPLLKTEDPEATMKALLDERNPVYAMADVEIESRTVNRDIITGELIDLGVANGLVEKSGAWYSYNTDRIGQGKDNVRGYLKEHPDMANEIDTRLREILLPKPEAESASPEVVAEAETGT